MTKLCPLMVSNVKQEPCTREQCAWWVELEDHEESGVCSVTLIAYNTGYHDHCEHE